MNDNPCNSFSCPLCDSKTDDLFYQTRERDFYQCCTCRVVFVPSPMHLNAQQEKAIYDLHNNDPNDSRYRNFLSQLAEPLLVQLKPGSYGLDFGCGPGPTLSLMLEDHGHKVELYDPFYFPNKQLLTQKYDFISMTEVAEHLNQPYMVFSNIVSMLHPNAHLAIMTQFIPKVIKFSEWGYKNDPTHIVFYREETFQWLKNEFRLEIIFLERNCVIFQKI